MSAANGTNDMNYMKVIHVILPQMPAPALVVDSG